MNNNKLTGWLANYDVYESDESSLRWTANACQGHNFHHRDRVFSKYVMKCTFIIRNNLICQIVKKNGDHPLINSFCESWDYTEKTHTAETSLPFTNLTHPQRVFLDKA